MDPLTLVFIFMKTWLFFQNTYTKFHKTLLKFKFHIRQLSTESRYHLITDVDDELNKWRNTKTLQCLKAPPCSFTPPPASEGTVYLQVCRDLTFEIFFFKYKMSALHHIMCEVTKEDSLLVKVLKEL